MEVTEVCQKNVVQSNKSVETAVIKELSMSDKSELHGQCQELDNASDAVCANKTGTFGGDATGESDASENNPDSGSKMNNTVENDVERSVSKDIDLQIKFPDSTKASFPPVGLNQINLGGDQNKQNVDQPANNKDKATEIKSNINIEKKTATQWDSKILDSVANNDLVCSEIENYLKNNLNLQNAPRRETAKVDLTNKTITNELFKMTSKMIDKNYKKDKVEVLNSIETAIFDKLKNSQNKLDGHADITFEQSKPGVEILSNMHSSSLFGDSIPILAGVTTCESLEKNEHMKASESVTNNHSNSVKLPEQPNTTEGTAKPTSTIDFLSGSFRSEETSDCTKDKNKNRNALRNVVVAQLSEALAENYKQFESNKNVLSSTSDNVEIKESDVTASNHTQHPEEETNQDMTSQRDLSSKKTGKVWSSDSEADSDSSDRSSYNSSTCDLSDDSCSTVSMMSKKMDNANGGLKKWHQPKTKGELALEDLPPIEDLCISVEEKELEQIGTVSSIVEELVIIQGSKDKPALDLDSVIFLDGGKPLGKVFDVFGPVVQPSYAVRFNSEKEILGKGITKGSPIYSAPSHTDITKYVFPEKLRREKGSDASWENNNEPPEQYIDYSDDEKEKEAKKKRGKPRTTVMTRNAFSQQAHSSTQAKADDKHTINGTPLRPAVLQVPRLLPPPTSPHPGFPYGPPPPLPPFASRYPAAPIFGAMPDLPQRPSFTRNNSTSNIPFTFSSHPSPGNCNNNIPFCISSPPLPPSHNNSSCSIPFCMPSSLSPPAPCNSSSSNIPFCVPSSLSPQIRPQHPPGSPLSNSMYCPPLQHNMLGPFGTTLPSFSGNTDITSRPLMPPSRIGAPSVAPFPPPPFASSLPIAPRPQFS